MSNTYGELHELFRIKYHQSRLKVNVGEFYRDLRPIYRWAHTHDFGDGLILEGDMGERHIRNISDFIDNTGLPRDLSGLKVLDVGPLTGGSSLLLAAMGATVYAAEISQLNCQIIRKLVSAYGLQDQIYVLEGDFRDLNLRNCGPFDIVVCAGVIYLVENPINALRGLHGLLRLGGQIYVQSHGESKGDSVCSYGGSSIYRGGKQRGFSDWHYFIPSRDALEAWLIDVGFSSVITHEEGRSLVAGAMKVQHPERLSKHSAMIYYGASK